MTKPYWIRGRWAATIQRTVKEDRLRGWHNRVTLGERFQRENGLWPTESVTITDVPYKDAQAQLDYQKNWQKQRRLDWLLEHGPCACGSWVNLLLDSIDGLPKSTPCVWTLSPARQAEELARYRVVCADCLRHAMTPARRHGTTTMYRDGCRCDDCRHATSARRRELRQRTGRH